jgi:hypothetical protein
MGSSSQEGHRIWNRQNSTLAEQIAASTARICFHTVHDNKFPNWAISPVFRLDLGWTFGQLLGLLHLDRSQLTLIPLNMSVIDKSFCNTYEGKLMLY